ncbi:hypothetical protein [Nereida sp. MMG025]|uniref:hypothetical protein n=1 Tax=Nereida sp. MMG025 TaxID=2909981 RepID=UPI001F159586|nr:hypothetical protein [Nereida sp. MMG025]MCF6444902.1 hypothetical protein [Nereida sp. MMG025]
MTKKKRRDLDQPARAQDRMADDEMGKTMRGWENIDKHGHKPGFGDRAKERQPENPK